MLKELLRYEMMVIHSRFGFSVRLYGISAVLGVIVLGVALMRIVDAYLS